MVIEGNKRGIKSRFFLSNSGKYNSVFKKENYEQIYSFCKENNVEILNLNEIKNYPGLTFLIEGVNRESICDVHISVSMTYMTDFSLSYDKYINNIDYSIFPSEFFAKKYNKISEKNLYLGSTKYDITLNKGEILKKYNLSNQKKALIIFPRLRDLNKIDMNKIYEIIERENYEILVKTRGKDPIPSNLRKGKYFEDNSWYPHTTMELIEISDFVINFGSTSIKECVLLKTPVINFDIKPFPLVLDELYNFEYCEKFSNNVDDKKLKNAIQKLVNSNWDDHFNKSIQKYLFKPGNVSSKILDRVYKK